MNNKCHIEAILKKRFANVQILETRDMAHEEHLLIRRRHLVSALNFLRSDPDTQIDMLVDMSAILHNENSHSFVFQKPLAPVFYEAIYLLRSSRFNYRLRLSVVTFEEIASLPTITGVFANAEWLECEVWDLFGIYIEGHPHLRRLLLYPSFEGHPLQK